MVLLLVLILLGILRTTLSSPKGGKAPPPSHPPFEPVHWDKALQDASSLHSFVQDTSFSRSDHIRVSMQQAQYSFHPCRLPIQDLSIELDTTVVGHVQEWIFGVNCTSALPFAVRRIVRETQDALDSMDNTTSILHIALNHTQEAISFRVLLSMLCFYWAYSAHVMSNLFASFSLGLEETSTLVLLVIFFGATREYSC